MDLTAAQIQDFLNPETFSRSRDVKRGEESSPLELIPLGESKAETDTLLESTNVLRASYDRLELILGNLSTMRQDIEALGEDATDDELDKIYARVRSLTAGIDQIVDQSQFNDNRVLDGSPVQLANGRTGGLQLEVQDVSASGENGLGLAIAEENALVSVFYSDSALFRNNLTGLVGLDIPAAEYATPTTPEDEIDSGEYRVRISYEGENSTVELMDPQLARSYARIENVDLSGTGETTVDFGVGLQVTFERDASLTENNSYDKFDFESKGAGILLADVSYLRSRNHVVEKDGPNQQQSASLSEVESATGPISGGTLSLTSASLSTTTREGATTPADGTYSVQINYFGKNSNAWLRDASGSLLEFKSGVDLSGQGETPITFNNGTTLNVNTAGLSATESITLEGKIDVATTLVSGPSLSVNAPSTATINNSDGSGTLSITGGSVQQIVDENAEEDAEAESPFNAGDTFQVEVNYFGENSNIWLRDSDGGLLGIASGINLAETGSVDVAFDNGISLTLNNNAFDVKTVAGGSASESAKLTTTVTLQTASSEESEAETPTADISILDDDDASIRTTSATDGSEQSLTISAIVEAALGQDEDGEDNTALVAGTYSIELRTLGTNSIATLRDADGRRMELLTQLDLTAEGQTTLNFGNGIAATIDNVGGYAESFQTLEIEFDYTPPRDGVSQNFDFEAYLEDVNAAIETVQAQMVIIDDTFVEINELQQLQASVAQGQGASVANSIGSGVLQLVQSSTEDSILNILQPSAANAQLEATLQSILSRGNLDASQFTTEELLESAANQTASSVLSLLS